MPSLLPFHFRPQEYKLRNLDQTAEAGWDTNVLSRRAWGTDPLPKNDMVGYHTRFGRGNWRRLCSTGILRENGYTDFDLVDTFSVLQNRLFRHVGDIVAGSTWSIKANV
jgi:hypothetical protein